MKARETGKSEGVVTGIEPAIFGEPAFARLGGKETPEALVARGAEDVDLAEAANDVEAKRDQGLMIAQVSRFVAMGKPTRAALEKFKRFIGLHPDQLVGFSAGDEREGSRAKGAFVQKIIVA